MRSRTQIVIVRGFPFNSHGAYQHVCSFHSQPFARAHFVSRLPFCAANAHVASFNQVVNGRSFLIYQKTERYQYYARIVDDKERRRVGQLA